MNRIKLGDSELAESVAGMTREQVLKEAADRAFYFYKQTDGTYLIPDCDPQTKQVLELLCAASLAGEPK
jgi:hypothetical protein